MKSSSRLRTPSELPDPIRHRLNMYVLAASAAGVGALALSQPADAKIVYTKTHRVIGFNQAYDLDLNHDKVTDFTIVNWEECSDYCGQSIAEGAAPGNEAIGYRHLGLPFASALKRGAEIGPHGYFQWPSAAMAGFDYTRGNGPWYNVTNRYLGLKFVIKGKIHYGWARLNVTGRKYPDAIATLTGYAYETTPNKPIIAGKAKGPDVITVQPVTPGTLAVGRR